MRANDMMNQIEESISPGENPKDVIVMIEIIAFERSMAIGEWYTERIYKYAATVICILLKPIKPPQFSQRAQLLRRQFSGISESRQIREEFRNILTEFLLVAPSAQLAIKRGFDNLYSSGPHSSMGNFGNPSISGA